MPRNSFQPRSYSREATQTTFGRLKKYFPRQRWVGSTNRYASRCVQRITSDCPSNGQRTINETHLAEYIAASAPPHCIDGWSFLGKALVSHAMGDSGACKHFAYYAQLRAVMSLMAAEGIGVFKNRHFAVNAANNRSSSLSGPIKRQTHEFAELQFRSWARTAKSGNLIEKIVRPNGIPLSEWFAQISSTSPGWLAQNWLEHWGYDLRRFKKDQSARNQASYRPTGLSQTLDYRNSTVTKESLEIVGSIWRMCLPDGRGGLSVDLHLLRASWDQHSKATGKYPKRADRIGVLKNFGSSETELKALVDFFDRSASAEDPMILVEARKKGQPEDHNYHLQMLSRATLLLRIATGATSVLLEETRTPKGDIKFWRDYVGENHGLWEPGAVDPIADMWAEVEEALRNIEEHAESTGNYYQWRSTLAKDIITLGGCERIGLSQLCL